MTCLYRLEHSYERAAGSDPEVKLIGTYRTSSEAEGALARVREQPGFRCRKSGFKIKEFRLNHPDMSDLKQLTQIAGCSNSEFDLPELESEQGNCNHSPAYELYFLHTDTDFGAFLGYYASVALATQIGDAVAQRLHATDKCWYEIHDAKIGLTGWAEGFSSF